MKNNFKKIGLTTMVLSSVLLAACGGDDKDASSGDVELEIMYYHGALADTTIENAKEEFPDYDLSFQQVPADDNYDMKLKTSLNSKTAADIATINDNIQDFKEYHDRFVNLLDHGTEEMKDKQIEWKWDSTIVDADDGDYQMAYPLDIGPMALYYNVAAFEEAGLPTDPEEVAEEIATFEDYKEAAKQMKDKADKPMHQSAGDLLADLYLQSEKKIYDEDGELTFADGELKEYWDFVVDAIENEQTLGAKSGSVDGSTSKERGMFGGYTQASWGIADLAELNIEPGEWQVTTSPGKPANNGGSYLAALSSTDFPEEATEVIMFLAGEDSQRINYEERGLFPTLMSVQEEEDFLSATNEVFGDEEFNKYFIEAAEELEYVELDPRESGAYDYFADEITLVETQGKDPEEAWEEAVRQAEVHSEG